MYNKISELIINSQFVFMNEIVNKSKEYSISLQVISICLALIFAVMPHRAVKTDLKFYLSNSKGKLNIYAQ